MLEKELLEEYNRLQKELEELEWKQWNVDLSLDESIKLEKETENLYDAVSLYAKDLLQYA